MRVSLFVLRICLIGGGYWAVSAFSSLDYDAISPRAIPLWAYVGAHLAILAGLFQSDAPWKLGLAVPLFFMLTIPMTNRGMSSMGHRLALIRPGMEVAEVRRIMTGFTEGSGVANPWSGGEFVSPGYLFFRDPRLAADPSSDFAFGVVAFRDGRAVDAYVDPD